jgi:AmpD protein
VKIDINTGLLEGANYLASPHCNARPAEMPIDMVVIHGISLPPNEFGTGWVEKFFCGNLDPKAHPYFETISHLNVSSHLFIDRQGSITQFVPFTRRAWHAGVSTFDGRTECNDFSIGIELEGADDMPYEKIQYTRLAEVLDALQKTYPAIHAKRIVGHSDIAPGRKTDPGESFDWAYLELLTGAKVGVHN